MQTVSIDRGRTIKTVIVTDAPEADDGDVLDYACEVMGETWRGEGRSLFGYQVVWTSTRTARVSLYSD